MLKNKNWNNKVTGFSNTVKKENKTPDYKTHEMSDHGKLIIPDNVLAQITYLHASVGKTEWSGILFFDVNKGSVADPKNFELEAKYIYLMDIGSAAYTEYEPDSDLIDMYDKYEDAINWKTGHIHTHHNMSAYFSGTDTGELKDNVDKYNYYLSLIVSFDGNYTAKVAFLSDVEIQSGMNYLDESGVKKVFKTKEKEKRMVTVDMDILYGVDTFTSDRIKQVNKKIEEEAKKKKSFPKQNTNWGRNTNWGWRDRDYGYGDIDDFWGQSNNQPLGNSINSKVDPLNLSTTEVEKLTRNLISVNSQLSEVRAVYSVLSELATDTKDGGLDIYYDYLRDNIDEILEEFFDSPLSVDEMIVVFDEVIKSINRFSGNFHLKNVVENIVEVLTDFLEYEKQLEDEDNAEEMEKKVLILNQTNGTK